MNAQKVKQIEIMQEIICKFYELQKEIINDNLEKNTPEYNFKTDIDTIRDMFVKASHLYIDRDTQSRVINLNSDIDELKTIIEKLGGLEFKINPFCQELYEDLLGQIKIELRYRENALLKL